MRIFVIGATGHIGSHVSARLLATGHEVIGFARSETAADKLRAMGVTPHLGDVADIDDLARMALAADATIFAPQLPNQEQEYAVVDALLAACKGTGKTFIFTSGTGVLGQRTWGEWSEDTFAEDDEFVPAKYALRRRHTELRTRVAAQDGVRAMVIRAPAVWGGGSHVIIERMLASIEKTGEVCYIGRGLNLYSHVHVEDLAELYRLALEKGVAGALYHAVAGELNNRTIAEYVARQRGVETRSVTPDEAMEIWDKFSVLFILSASSRSRSPRSRRELGWAPVHADVGQAILDGALDGRRHG